MYSDLYSKSRRTIVAFSADIHWGTATQDGPVVINLFNSTSTPTGKVNGILAEGTITSSDIKLNMINNPGFMEIVAKDNMISKPSVMRIRGLIGSVSDLVILFTSNYAYVNVHTQMHNNGEIREFARSLHFFLTALARGRYSGSSESTIQEDINKINNSKDFTEAINKLHEGVEPISIDKKEIANMVHYQGEGRFFKLILYLVSYKNSAVDWFSKTRLGYLPNNEINRDFSIEEHHFFPKSLLKSVGVERERIELLANITFINPGTNKRLKEEPSVYIKRFNIDAAELEKQIVPTNANDYLKLKNYEAFIDLRSQLIADNVKRYLQGLFPQLY